MSYKPEFVVKVRFSVEGFWERLDMVRNCPPITDCTFMQAVIIIKRLLERIVPQ